MSESTKSALAKGRQGLEEWVEARRHTDQLGSFLVNKESIEDIDFTELLQRRWRFHNCTFRRCRFSGDIEAVDFTGSRFESCDFSGAQITGCDFNRTSFDSNTPPPASASLGSWQQLDLTGGGKPPRHMENVSAVGGNWNGADLKGAKFVRVAVTKTDMSNADLRGTTFEECVIRDTTFRGAKFSGRSRVLRPDFQGHTHATDGTEALNLGHWRALRWSVIRFLAEIPLFGISYLALAFSVATLAGLEWINRLRLFSEVTYPIPAPDDLALLFWSSFLLAIASTLFALFCPERIKEYSETKWVDELGRHRLIYIDDDLRRWGVQPVALATPSTVAIRQAVLGRARVCHALGHRRRLRLFGVRRWRLTASNLLYAPIHANWAAANPRSPCGLP